MPRYQSIQLLVDGREKCFPTGQDGPLSRDALERRLAKHAAAAAELCSSMRGKR